MEDNSNFKFVNLQSRNSVVLVWCQDNTRTESLHNQRFHCYPLLILEISMSTALDVARAGVGQLKAKNSCKIRFSILANIYIRIKIWRQRERVDKTICAFACFSIDNDRLDELL